jgi:hypothetical protein
MAGGGTRCREGISALARGFEVHILQLSGELLIAKEDDSIDDYYSGH